ncbi:MAG TPA: lysylphosphatidylglycerol synthase domain-containing protein, partial [Gaiellaceae bacterium]
MRQIFGNRKFQIVLNGGFALVLLGVMIVGGRKFAHNGFALRHADPLLAAGATLLFLIAYVFKAWGWQRLFAGDDRPGASALAFAGGAACVGGVALPGRLDDALRIACVKRYPGVRTQIGAVALSLVVLGLLDNVALAPYSAVAAVHASSWTVRIGFGAVAIAGILAAALVASLPSIAGRKFVMRFRIGRWLASNTHCNRRAAAALVFISVSWALRATAVFLLLDALSMRSSFPLALAFLCASAASAALPIAPAGAATQAGAGSAILIASGVHAGDAIAFSVAAQVL